MALFNIFRRSLFLKVFTLSSIISIALIYFLGSNLFVRISNGIIDEKISASLSEAESAIQYADYRFIIANLNPSTDMGALVEEVVRSTNLSAKDSGREIAFINSNGKEIRNIPPITTSNFLQPESIPSTFRAQVQNKPELQWTRT
ncbi:MAG: hypothetical protein EBW80_07005, partial [Burkholderiaceae bacterium]|nr:hypothetical protein [Burkholderiaceae bacterium]